MPELVLSSWERRSVTGTRGLVAVRAARVVVLVVDRAVDLVVRLGADVSLRPGASNLPVGHLWSFASRGRRFGEMFVVEAYFRRVLGSARFRGGGLVVEG